MQAAKYKFLFVFIGKPIIYFTYIFLIQADGNLRVHKYNTQFL